MTILEQINSRICLSVEVFPPKRDSDPHTIYQTIAALGTLRPDFISVTYGAGGSTKGFTAEIADAIVNRQQIPALAHLTCVGENPESIANVIARLQASRVSSVLALRGDVPAGENQAAATRHFPYAAQLITFLRRHYPHLEIGAAAYPEGHMDCPSPKQDLLHLKAKVDAGVDFLITQLFFDNDRFYRFMDAARNAGIQQPVLAGIMPVTSRRQIERILSLSRTAFPTKFQRILDRYENHPQALHQAGVAYATEQIIDLISSGTEGIHLYTMNKPALAEKIFGDIKHIRSCLQASAT
jgi:methylenetetrahydrofolate reductase (NADPH)